MTNLNLLRRLEQLETATGADKATPTIEVVFVDASGEIVGSRIFGPQPTGGEDRDE
jgi:hypothetical protein